MIKILSLLLCIFFYTVSAYSQITLKLNESKKGFLSSEEISGQKMNENSSGIYEMSLNKKLKSGKNNFTKRSDTLKYHRFYPQYLKRSSLLVPIYEAAGMNIGLSLFNNYVSGAEFAKISFKSVRHNLDTGFVWDDDVFVVNQFGHPFHGSIYFNTARSTGFSYWESIPFAFGGSLMWEMFMETDPPQTNDILQTTLGGTMVGEMTYRLSSLILDESTSGPNRIVRETISTILNPARGFNRLISGDMFRRTPANVNDVFPVTSRLNVGYAGINPSSSVNFDKSHLMVELLFIYGKEIGKDKEYNPFEFFRIRAGFDAGKNDAPSTWISAYGLITAKNILKKKDAKTLVFGVFHDYDYYYNTIIKLGTQSVGVGLIYNTTETKSKIRMLGSLHTNFVAMGALNSIYQKGPNRNYDYTIGNKTMLEMGVNYKFVNFLLEYRFYYLYTVNGFPGHSIFGVLNPKLLVNVYKGVGIGAEYLFYHRHGTFENVADYNKRISEQRLYLSYLF
ncbi:MAG: DUF3943 domain-containing protein [Ignavibacteria bacterium]|nr:DUF3943 domain-containing protein [Ignavibacteria bacterium]